MPKGQQRGNKEAKKPKAPRAATPVPAGPGLPLQAAPAQNPTPRGPKR